MVYNPHTFDQAIMDRKGWGKYNNIYEDHQDPVSARPDPPTKGWAVKAAPTLAAWQRNLTCPYHIPESPSPRQASSSAGADPTGCR